jgi:hypothetical protein
MASKRVVLVGAFVAVAIYGYLKWTGSIREYEIRGVVSTENDQEAQCRVTINSVTAPYYSPITLRLHAGDSFSHVMRLGPPHTEFVVDVKCEGYGIATRTFKLKQLWIGRVVVDLGKIVVSARQ